jgi:hypothetical protein
MDPSRISLQDPDLNPLQGSLFCERCGASLSASQHFCEQCGARISADAPAIVPGGGDPGAGMASRRSGDDVLVWQVSIPLINNRFMLRDIGIVVVMTIVVMQVVLAMTGLFVGEGIVVLPWQVYAGIAIVFVLGFLIVALLFYQNRIHMQFAVGPAGVVSETGRKERGFTRAAILAGILSMSPTAAGAGMLAAAREVTAVSWRDIERVRVYPRQRVISLGSSWRARVRLNCTPENFALVTERVQDYVAGAAESRREHSDSRSTRQVVTPFAIWIVLAVLFGVMTRAWYWAAEDTALLVLIAVPLLIAAGLVGRTGWVLALPSGVLAALALLITIGNGMEESESMFGGTYLMYELDSGEFWLSIAGCVGLIALSLMIVIGFGPFRWQARHQVEH